MLAARFVKNLVIHLIIDFDRFVCRTHFVVQHLRARWLDNDVTHALEITFSVFNESSPLF